MGRVIDTGAVTELDVVREKQARNEFTGKRRLLDTEVLPPAVYDVRLKFEPPQRFQRSLPWEIWLVADYTESEVSNGQQTVKRLRRRGLLSIAFKGEHDPHGAKSYRLLERAAKRMNAALEEIDRLNRGQTLSLRARIRLALHL